MSENEPNKNDPFGQAIRRAFSRALDVQPEAAVPRDYATLAADALEKSRRLRRRRTRLITLSACAACLLLTVSAVLLTGQPQPVIPLALPHCGRNVSATVQDVTVIDRDGIGGVALHGFSDNLSDNIELSPLENDAAQQKWVTIDGYILRLELLKLTAESICLSTYRITVSVNEVLCGSVGSSPISFIIQTDTGDSPLLAATKMGERGVFTFIPYEGVYEPLRMKRTDAQSRLLQTDIADGMCAYAETTFLETDNGILYNAEAYPDLNPPQTLAEVCALFQDS